MKLSILYSSSRTLDSLILIIIFFLKNAFMTWGGWVKMKAFKTMLLIFFVIFGRLLTFASDSIIIY